MLCVLGKLLVKFDERAWNIKTQKFGIINQDNKGNCPRGLGGGGGGYTEKRGSARKGYLLSGFRYMKG